MVKNPPGSTGDMGSIPGSGRSLGKGNGNPLQYSQQSLAGYSPWGLQKNQTQLSNYTTTI